MEAKRRNRDVRRTGADDSTHYSPMTLRESIVHFLVYLVVVAVAIVVSGSNLMGSDGSYYIVTARSFIETGHFTFDQIHTTNGFFWLWMFIEIAAGALLKVFGFPLDTSLYESTVVSIQVLLYASAMVVFTLVVRELLRARHVVVSGIAILIFGEPLFLDLTLNGLESSLFLLTMLLTAYFALKQRFVPAFVAANVMVLTRIEGVIVFPVLLYLFRHDIWKHRYAVFPYAVLAVGVLNFLADQSIRSNSSSVRLYWMRVAFDNVFRDLDLVDKAVATVRSLFKIDSPLGNAATDLVKNLLDGSEATAVNTNLWINGIGVVLVMSLLTMAATVVLKHPRETWQRLNNPAILILLTYSTISYMAYKTILFMPITPTWESDFPVFDYQAQRYFIPLNMSVELVLFLVLFSKSRYLPIALALAVLFFASAWVYETTIEDTDRPSIAASGDESANCQPTSQGLIFAQQNDDGEAYRYRVRMIIMDGVTTGKNMVTGEYYLDVLKSGDMTDYLRRVGVTHISPGLGSLFRYSGGLDLRGKAVTICGLGTYVEVE